MRTQRFGSILLALTLTLTLILVAPAAAKTKSVPAPAGKLVVYYLHGHARCQSCLKIEAYTKEAVETGFAPELKSGKLEWKVLDIEDKGNGHYVTDYQLATKSVVLSRIKGGKEIAWKNLTKVWPLLGNKDEFEAYIRTETRQALEGL